jgi:hypothetical protein
MTPAMRALRQDLYEVVRRHYSDDEIRRECQRIERFARELSEKNVDGRFDEPIRNMRETITMYKSMAPK